MQMTDDCWDLLYRVGESLCCIGMGVLFLLFCGLNITFGYTGEAAHLMLLIFLVGGLFFLALGIFLTIDCGRQQSAGVKQ
ncbi:hypothetical protein Mboo_1544 [Methanoregula boonei 6A8]|uniref:Uncharacterized protein n=2 Tax=Methanoregula TaxID=395331 RepID=A7I8K0_METB6|nr:hypothetical protein Mboo_1544 [Methanoregula boonei 6A8]